MQLDLMPGLSVMILALCLLLRPVLWSKAVLILAGGLIVSPVVNAATDSFCATVKIEIKQELTLERQAFDAHMRINNGLQDLSVENVQVDVLFTDENGDPVAATSDLDNTEASFFIRIDSLSGIDNISGTGSVAAKTDVDIHWLIIPAPGSAGTNPNGKMYFVGAVLKYTLAGEEKVVEISPDYIFVKPMPLLTLDYFLPKDVYADDAFSPMIEPPVPFNLGVRVKNNGQGVARDIKIDSAQPKIIENKLGLIIDFRITGSSVYDEPVAPTLLVDIGDIQPASSGVARWVMETTLSGEFTEFTAEFSHADELGGELTSLMEATNAHELIHDVLVDLPGRDTVKDFLARDGDAIRIYESSGLDTDVSNQSANASLNVTAQNGGQSFYDLTTPATDGFVYVRLADPNAGTKKLTTVMRSDGKLIHPANAWFSKKRRTDNGWDHYIHLFDSNTTGRYQLVSENIVSEPVAPVLQYIPDRKVAAGTQVSFLVEASDLNGTLPTVSATPLPSGARLAVDSNGASGVSTYIFDWTPTNTQAGTYDITFSAMDDVLITTQIARILVCDDQDTDCDGMNDEWEMETFGTLDRNGLGDFDNDGHNDLLEYINGTDPKVKNAPSVPVIKYPLNDVHIATTQPLLQVYNSLHSPDAEIRYEFETYTDQALTQLATEVSVLEQNEMTSWKVESTFQDNQWYFWRVRACDPLLCSEWGNARFFVNMENDAPSIFYISNPSIAQYVSSNQPALEVTNSIDPDGDTVTYRYEVYLDSLNGSLVASADEVAQGDTGTTTWQVDVALEEGRWYYWRVTASDSYGAIRVVEEVGSFMVDMSNTAPATPSLLSPENDSTVSDYQAVLEIENALDVDGDALSYLFELDVIDTFNSVDKRTSPSIQEELDGTTSWSVDGLLENTWYYWRTKADDGRTQSSWSTSRFFVNVENQPPATPVVDNPGEGAWVESVRPVLSLHTTEDPDGDSVHYHFELYDSVDLNNLIGMQAAEQQQWSPDLDLADNSWYYWRARTLDADLESEWTGVYTFFVNDNGFDDPPTISVLQPSSDITVKDGKIRIAWIDEDRDSNASIGIYYEFGSRGSGAVAIIEDVSEDLEGINDAILWDISGLAKGTYHIYARISDQMSEAISYAKGELTIGEQTVGSITVTPVSDITETGVCMAYDLVLNSPPTDEVKISLQNSHPAEGVVAPDNLVFTVDNWFTPQTISITGFSGCILDSSIGYQVTILPLESTDDVYSGVDPIDIQLTEEGQVDTPDPEPPKQTSPNSGGGGSFTPMILVMLLLVGWLRLLPHWRFDSYANSEADREN